MYGDGAEHTLFLNAPVEIGDPTYNVQSRNEAKCCGIEIYERILKSEHGSKLIVTSETAIGDGDTYIVFGYRVATAPVSEMDETTYSVGAIH
jgi:hypothetical protein